MTAPILFLSHASEDKPRFVLGFAERLREKGVDVWLDKWEIHPGDSLVGKIFDEGIAKADAITVVISKNSVDKAWVREELDASVVKRIEQKTRLIPIVLDDAQVPEPIKHLLWVKVNDPANFEEQVD